MSNYENAITTKMLATNCLICGRALVDATSCETGIGPECRNKHGIKTLLDDGQRHVANRLVYEAAIAAQEGKIDIVRSKARDIESVGYPELAAKVLNRFKNAEKKVSISIELVGSTYHVVTPYRRGEAKAFVDAWRNIPGRKWVNGVNEVPKASKAVLWELLKEFFGGQYAKGPKGVFRIPKPVPQPKQMEFGVV